ncbi:MAG: hypothetical protein ACR2I0_00805 [Rhodoferax sp.]
MDATTSPTPDNASRHVRLTLWDALFLQVLIAVVFSVAWVGHLAYEEGGKTEVTKRNGEAWTEWLTKASPERGKAGFQPEQCAKGMLPQVPAPVRKVLDETNTEIAVESSAEQASAAAPSAAQPRTWGPCYQALTQKGGALASIENPFFNAPLQVVAKCDMVDRNLAGSMVLEKVSATPPGSAISSVTTPLVESDPIDQTMQLHVVVCDKGAYPLRVAEFDF